MEKKYLDFSLEELGSKKSMPGGGSVAAYALNLANGLASMVANFTSGKKKYAAYQADIERILEECQVFHRESMDMVDRDAEAFLPQSTRCLVKQMKKRWLSMPKCNFV